MFSFNRNACAQFELINKKNRRIFSNPSSLGPIYFLKIFVNHVCIETTVECSWYDANIAAFPSKIVSQHRFFQPARIHLITTFPLPSVNAAVCEVYVKLSYLDKSVCCNVWKHGCDG